MARNPRVRRGLAGGAARGPGPGVLFGASGDFSAPPSPPAATPYIWGLRSAGAGPGRGGGPKEGRRPGEGQGRLWRRC